MSTSLNGWPVLDRGSRLLRSWEFPQADRRVTLRNGSAGFLLVHMALYWHEEVEEIDKGILDDWGHAVRPPRGSSTGFSNHSSGTAFDINATKHVHHSPISKSFTPSQISKIRDRLKIYGGVIEWGGDWSPQWVDGMHIEINGPIDGVERVAKRMMDTPRGKRILEANNGQRAVILS